MAEHTPGGVPRLVPALRDAVDVEGKVPRALATFGPFEGRAVVLLDAAGAPFLPVVQAAGAQPVVAEVSSPLRIPVHDATQDLVVTLWTGFQGVDPGDLAEVDRALRPYGRLVVVHDYGRDDVSLLADPAAPAYRVWSRREGPFLHDNGFKIRVVHCFWTFPTLEEAREALAETFGERGAAVAAGLKRPRLAWNVAVYHRYRAGIAPAGESPHG